MTKNYQVTFLKIYFFFCYCIQFKQILLFVNLMADNDFLFNTMNVQENGANDPCLL
jgi:hypothetical protein